MVAFILLSMWASLHQGILCGCKINLILVHAPCPGVLRLVPTQAGSKTPRDSGLQVPGEDRHPTVYERAVHGRETDFPMGKKNKVMKKKVQRYAHMYVFEDIYIYATFQFTHDKNIYTCLTIKNIKCKAMLLHFYICI